MCVCVDIVLLLLYLRHTIEIFGWCSLSMVLNFSESEVFAGEA